jgi:localization factor PodJL
MARGGWLLRAAEGDWPATSPDDLRAVIRGLETRLALLGPDPLEPATAAALLQALDGLAVRLARQEAAARGRDADLSAAVAGLSARLAEGQAGIAARLDAALVELDAARIDRTADPGPIRAVLVAAAALAGLAVTGAGVLVVSRPEAAAPVVAERFRIHSPISLRPGLAPTPGPGAPTSAGLPTAPQPSSPSAPAESFATVEAALRRGEATALARLTGLAQAGDPEAQLHLASLYETASAGLTQDLAAARLWTRRAAGGGNRVAMHNLGLFLTEGDGGPRDLVEAAAWFRRAADRGVVDSQYNLGLLYEAGRGVPRNLREAYRWFSIAANAGDVAAREKQVELEGRLADAERAGLNREAADYRPGPAVARSLDPIIPPATTLAETQALLARQGYYVGPVDGVASPQLSAAAQAYLRDHPETARAP